MAKHQQKLEHGPACECTRCRGFQPGHELSVKHGAKAIVKLAPRATELADQIRDLVPARSDSDEPTIRLLAMTLAQVEAAATYVDENGIVDGKGNPQGILRHLGTMTNTAARLCGQLGLTPTSRAALGLDLSRTGEALRAHLDERYESDGDS